MSQGTYKYWSERLTNAGIVHEVLNDYPDFREHPEAKAHNTGSWLDQPGLMGPAPVPSLATGERLPQRHISFAWATFVQNPYGTRL